VIPFGNCDKFKKCEPKDDLPGKLSKALLKELKKSHVINSLPDLLQEAKLTVKTIVVLYRFDQSCSFFSSFVNKLKKVQPSMLRVIVAEEKVHFFKK
jgi:hypothetical protein